jgi:GTP pyrophosphokinase
MIRLDDILDMVSAYNPDADLDEIKKAYVFAAKAHQGQTRRSGEPYLVHPMEVASILARMQMDVPSILTALLHDTVEDTVATLEEIEQFFGKEIAGLVDGVTKLSKIVFSTLEERQAENFRKMIMAMALDIRVILVKLADRVHNMRTLSHMPENKQIRIAQETLDIYAPIANRLGMQQFKVELEDLALKYLKPDVFRVIDEKVHKRRSQREKYITEIRTLVSDKVKEHNIHAEITGRVKHYYSIMRKMELQNIPLDEVHDIVAFRIIVDSVQQCYEALGVIHALWRPVPGRFKDYIAMPKANNYKSLHTTVIGPHGDRVEFQIRTSDMHDIAEHGVAAHWMYKEGTLIEDKDELKFRWIRRLLEWQRELSDPTEFLDTVKLDLFADDVYVFTPNGELKELPRGSTPVDFAYSVHTDVGHSCVGAKVNGKIVPLRYQLHSGDTVEILTSKERRPNKDWLQFVKTSRAKAKIRNLLRGEEREKSSAIGRELLEKMLDRYKLNLNRVLKSKEMAEYAKKASYDSPESVLAAIGYGRISPLQIISLFIPREKLHPEERPKEKVKESVVGKLVKRLTKSRGLVKVSGMSDMLVNFGKCCSPLPGDPIVGYVTRGRGVSIHVMDCPRVVGMDPARRINVEWDKPEGAMSEATIRVVCVDKPGLLAAITDAITGQGANIATASVRTQEDKTAINTFGLQLKDVNQLRAVIKALERVGGVITVERVREH